MSEIVHGEHPPNSEPSLAALVRSDHFYTPTRVGFKRNHAEFPLPSFVDAWQLTVLVEDEDGSERKVWQGGRAALGEVAGEPRALRMALQCAGNRRDELSLVRETEGVQWSSGTISNHLFEGFLLKAFLSALKIEPNQPGRHVHFESGVGPCEEAEWYGSSFPLQDLLGDDAPPALLAYASNGESLSLEHGAPLRLAVPGVIGARSVKWLQTIAIRSSPSRNAYMTSDYKILPPDLTSPTREEKLEAMHRTEPMEGWDMNLAISPGEQTGAGFRVRGWAIGSRGVPLSTVEVLVVRFDDLNGPPSSSLSEVRSFAASRPAEAWSAAELDRGDPSHGDGGREWGWVLFEAVLDVKEEGRAWVVARCADVKGNVQDQKATWNVRGLGCSAWAVREL